MASHKRRGPDARPDRLVLQSGVQVDRWPGPAALHEGRHSKKVSRTEVARQTKACPTRRCGREKLVTSRPALRRSSACSASPSGPPVECVGDAGESMGQGGQVLVKPLLVAYATGTREPKSRHPGARDAANVRVAAGCPRRPPASGDDDPAPQQDRRDDGHLQPGVSTSTKEALNRLGNELGEGSCDPVAVAFWSTGMKEAPSDERRGPLTWVETRGIEPRTSCLQTRGPVAICRR